MPDANLCIRSKKGTQEIFGHETEHILSVTESASAQERIAESANYILHNWMPARTRLCHDDHLIGCSAVEWCRDGANQMAHLRAYYFNNGNILELVKAQKFPKAAGAEDTFIIDPHKLGETMYSEWGEVRGSCES